MIVGFYQSVSPAGDLATGLQTVETSLAAAAAARVDMLVLPEAFLPGYGAVTDAPPPGWEDVPGRLSDLCRQHSVALTTGLPEFRSGSVFNTALAIGADG